jgi:hypothetical protein
MNPECPQCEANTTRRIQRQSRFSHHLMRFFGHYPWECLTCQTQFFSMQRYTRAKRHPLGEVYTANQPAPEVRPGSEEAHS